MKNGYIQDKGNGKYYLTVTMGNNSRGERKRFYRMVTAKDMSDAEKKLAVFYEDCLKQRVNLVSNVTFKDFVDIWKKQYAEIYLKKSTLIVHYRNLKLNFDMLNDKKMGKIKPFHITQWITYLYQERQLSPKTVRNNFSLLRSILEKAVIWEYIDRNPAEHIELPKRRIKEAAYYGEEDLNRLLEALAEVPIEAINYKVGILLGLFGGLRRGEICGLDEGDVFLDSGMVRIRQTRMLMGDGTGIYIDTPKTVQSVREVVLPKHVVAEIRFLLSYQDSQKKNLGNRWQGSKALLKNEVGNPLYPQSLLRWFYKLQKENGLPHLSLHGLRHSHVAMLRDSCSNINVEQVSKRLGHSQKSTTLNIYSHLFKNRDIELANILDEKYLGKK